MTKNIILSTFLKSYHLFLININLVYLAGVFSSLKNFPLRGPSEHLRIYRVDRQSDFGIGGRSGFS